ncbi:MAG: divalent-cation tolerance protein CutA [Candidatus Aminicenantes bacterium]|nr:divalent-cation tolerance protein CutA [Candidatus Aminicenantes bacterium]
MSEFILVMTTVPDEETGRILAENIVTERIAACVTLSAAARSFYWWQGKIASEREFTLLIKTQNHLYPELEIRILELHPYEVPEIVCLPILAGSKTYLDWIKSVTKS